ncbi:hypothetical protein BURK2_00693 [Burkholderiales bacterium]|nr:hypothetical protein BURK2_00693 [Burkholderiales bacterium]
MERPFETIVKSEFDFLATEFGFRLDHCKRTRGGVDVLYVNDTCGVRIDYEFREAYLFITIYKLLHGKFVDNPRPIKPDSILTGYSLDDVLLRRAPDAIVKPAYAYGADSEYYDKERGLSLYVAQFARNLKEHVADVLSGDFTVFSSLEATVKKRAQEGTRIGGEGGRTPNT